MRWTILLIILIAILMPIGCGGVSQDDLMRHAQKNSGMKQSDDEETPPKEKKKPSEESKSDDDATEKKVTPPKKTSPQQTTPAKKEKAQPKTTVAKSGKQQDQVASTPSPKETASEPKKTAPSKPISSGVIAAADDFPSSTLPSEEPTEIIVQTDSGELASVDPQEAARLIAKQQAELDRLRKAEAARRLAEEKALKAGKDMTLDSAGNLIPTGEYLKNLFDRLVNPENLIPEEFLRVGEELAQMGASTEALAYYYGWAVTTDKPQEWAEQAKWSSTLRRPAATLHFGVGIEYSGLYKWLTKAQPIGSRDKTFSGLKRDKVNSDLKRYTGELSDRLLMGLDERIEDAALGSLFQPDPEYDKSKRRFSLKWQAQPTGFKPESLGPGITYLGIGKKRELLFIAEPQNVDVLALFEMELRQPRSGPLVNITTLKLINAKTGEELTSTRQMNNIRIAFDRQDRSSVDPVEKEFQELFTYVDDSLQLSPFPSNIRPEHALGRVKELAEKETSHPLPVLAEMRIYFAKGLIDQAALIEGYQALIGIENGRLLASGTVPQRVGVIADYLPKIEPSRR